MDISGNKMLHLKQDLVFLRQRLAECSEESAKQSIRREIMEKETYYNILADRQRLSKYKTANQMIGSFLFENYSLLNFPFCIL